MSESLRWAPGGPGHRLRQRYAVATDGMDGWDGPWAAVWRIPAVGAGRRVRPVNRRMPPAMPLPPDPLVAGPYLVAPPVEPEREPGTRRARVSEIDEGSGVPIVGVARIHHAVVIFRHADRIRLCRIDLDLAVPAVNALLGCRDERAGCQRAGSELLYGIHHLGRRRNERESQRLGPIH